MHARLHGASTHFLLTHTDDFEVVNDDVTDVMNWMGNLGGTEWFPGHLNGVVIRPCGKLATLKFLYKVMKFKTDAVRCKGGSVIWVQRQIQNLGAEVDLGFECQGIVFFVGRGGGCATVGRPCVGACACASR